MSLRHSLIGTILALASFCASAEWLPCTSATPQPIAISPTAITTTTPVGITVSWNNGYAAWAFEQSYSGSIINIAVNIEPVTPPTPQPPCANVMVGPLPPGQY